MIALALAVTIQAAPIDFPAAWKEVRTMIETGYYARKDRHEEMMRRLDDSEPLAKAAKSEADFNMVLDKMIAGFGDSHFDFVIRSEPGFYLLDAIANSTPAKFPSIGAWIAPAEKGLLVTMVLNGGEAEKQGIRPGDILMNPDGKTIDVNSWAQTSELKLKLDHSGEERSVTFHPKLQSTIGMFLDATQASVRTYRDGERRIGYVRIWLMINRDFPAVLSKAMQNQLRGVDALIVDLRDGYGGRPEGTLKALRELPKTLPLVVLINGGTRSAKEVTAAEIQQEKRAVLIGSRTAGAVLGTFPRRLTGEWAYLEIPMVKVQTNGKSLEKLGVEPDVPVAKEFDDAGNDLVIQQALTFLHRKPDEAPKR